MDIVALIPAYKPSSAVLDVARELIGANLRALVVIDDGSGGQFEPLFGQIAALERTTVLTHSVNLGKGAALKTGINYICNQFGDEVGIVTVDADGQHRVADALKVAGALVETGPTHLILGARAFTGDVPFRSQIGNRLTRHLIKWVHGLELTDSQTGLRAFGADAAKAFLSIRSNRYDFELDMLILTKQLKIGLSEIPIETIYIDENQSSHFNPIFDSAKIYFSLFRFLWAGIFAAVIDNIIFICLFLLGSSVLTSQISSRVVVMFINYVMVRNMVFHSTENHLNAVPKYVTIVIVLGFISYGLIIFASEILLVPVILAKVLVETIIFLSNYFLQRFFLFKEDQT